MTETAVQPTETSAPASLPASVLRDALTAALIAASTETYLPVLNAVQMTKTGTQLVLRSTDRYRLMRVTAMLADGDAADWMTLLSVADVKQILTLLPRKGFDVARLGPDAEGKRFSVALESGASLSLTPLDGDFPKTDQIIPSSETAAAVDRMGFRPKQLADLAKLPGIAKNNAVYFRFNGPTKPLIAEWDDGACSYLHLLMPLREEA
jgi:DNA polymerase III sliding clamp (beta) subunit (PCNA family)